MTALDLVTDALFEIQVLEAGEVASAADSSLAYTRLNKMLDSFNAERLLIFSIVRVNLGNLTIGQQTYTLGPGAYFNQLRPVRIERYGIISLNNISQPLELPLEELTVDQWADIPVKNIQSSLPQKIWDDQGWPYRTLSYWCIPSANVQTTIYPWVQLNSFPDLTTDVTFPPAYYECLLYNLALRLANPFGGNVPPLLPQMAAESKARVKALNVPILDLHVDPALTQRAGVYNWLSDEIGRGPR